MRVRPLLVALLLLAGALPAAGADDAQLARGIQAVRRMAGCFLVDYSYVEVQALKPGYVRDPRVYDVNRDKSAKEWIVRRDDLAAPDPAAACPLPDRPGRRAPARHRGAAPVGGLGVRRPVSSTTSYRRSTGSRVTCAPRPGCGPAA